MQLLVFPNAWTIAVANDHYGGDGKRAHDTAYTTDASPLRRAFLYIPPNPLI